jgi:Fe-S cluster biogenesis protein NfuA
MDPASISITAEPLNAERCKFVVGVPVYTGGLRRFTSREDATGSPLAEALFDLPGVGVREVVVAGDLVTVGKAGTAPWQEVGKQVGAAIRAALAGPRPAVATKSEPAANDDALYERVARLFDEQVNPMVARHGGRVELIDVQDAVVLLRMAGGCQGCGMADVTLRQGIEAMLGQHVPEVKGIADITDHSAGTNPYFAAAKK